MVNRFRVAVINKSNLESEANKRFSDRNYSKKTLKNYAPDIKNAKFIERKQGFSIYEVPLKKVKEKKFRKGEKVKIKKSFPGFGEYGIRKGTTGIVKKHIKYKDRSAYQINFPKAGKELTIYHYELKKY